MNTQSVINHIRSVTPKSTRNRRRRDTASDVITGLAALVGVAGFLVIAWSITK